MSDEMKSDPVGVEGLLPCPFCGGPAELIDFGPGDAENEGGSCIACTRCQASGPVEFGRKENFITNWNKRAQQPAAVDGAMVERAFDAWCDVADVDEWRVRNAPEALRAALTAALAGQQGGRR